MQRLEVSCAARLIYTSLGAKGLSESWSQFKLFQLHEMYGNLSEEEKKVARLNKV